MIGHHISQLKGMNADTEHLEGQGINQPSQNKEDTILICQPFYHRKTLMESLLLKISK